MSRRPTKIALIGARGFETQSEAQLRVECFTWDKISRIQNLRDYDITILNLLSCDPQTVNWSEFDRVLNRTAMNDITSPGGAIFIVGDPRFEVRRSVSTGNEITEPFLSCIVVMAESYYPWMLRQQLK